MKHKFNKIIEKIQKGGAFTQNEFVQTIVINIFLFVCYNVIFICLFKFNNYYSYIYYLLIALMIVSFFTFIITFFFNPLGKYVTKMFVSYEDTGDVNPINLFASFILSSCNILQTVSAILIFIVFYSNKPPSDTFSLTTTNANNLFNYQVLYIYSYLACIVFYIIISSIDNNIGNTITINILSILVGLILCGIVSYMFYSGYQLYYDVCVKVPRKQLYQGSTNNTVTGTAQDQIGAAKMYKTVAPLPTLPVCTPTSINSSPTSQNGQNGQNDQCYS